ncbi:MAG: acetate kinase [Bacteroidales bacterium]
MKILVLNCGSSSLKYQLLDMKTEEDYSLLVKGQIERIGLPIGKVTYEVTGQDKFKEEHVVKNHTDGVKEVLDLLISKERGVLKSLEEIEAVGHRIVQGGDIFSDSCIVTPKVKSQIEELGNLAPLHNPAHILGINAVDELMPNIPQVVVFDTAFHHTMPAHVYLYPIPYEYYEKYKMRRYGAHGTSHRFVAYKAAKMAGIDINNSRIITCHLGNGSSITAVKNGKSIDTTMGFTPNDGMIMGTRCGSMDPKIITGILEETGISPEELDEILNKKSGMLGLGGVSSDCRDNEAAAAEGNKRAQIVLDMLFNHVLKYVGGFIAEMGGVDIIAFTGGIGENNPPLRAFIAEKLAFMGVKYDAKVNNVKSKDIIYSTPDSTVKMLCCLTNEELVIAQDTLRLVSEK